MRCGSIRLVFGLAVLIPGIATGRAQSVRIPTTHGTSFAGAQVTLPDDLRGKVGVLVIGFSKSSGDVCKGWEHRLEASYQNSREVMYYQMPVLEAVPKLMFSSSIPRVRCGGKRRGRFRMVGLRL